MYENRYFIVFAAIALCDVNARTLNRSSREAPYPCQGSISHYEDLHLPFAAYGLPTQQIVSIIPSVQSKTLVVLSLPASLSVSDIPSPILLQTPGIPAESYGAPIVPQKQAFFAVPALAESLSLPQIQAPIYNVQPIQFDITQQSIVTAVVPHVSADQRPKFYMTATLYATIISTEASKEQSIIPPAPQPLSLPQLSIPISSESPREPFATNGIPTLHEVAKTEAPIPAAINRSPFISTEAPRTESTTQQLVIPPAPQALPLPKLIIPVSVELPKEEPKTETPVVPAAVYEAPPRIEVPTQQLFITPAPQPEHPNANYGAPTVSPIVQSGPYPPKGPVSHYGDAIILSSPAVLSAPIVDSTVLSGTYPSKGPVSHYDGLNVRLF